MRPYLLDVNVLIALTYTQHVHHRQARGWFTRNRQTGFRTCPLTQLGFVRLASNPKLTAGAVTPATALAALTRITELAGHDFWPDDLPCELLQSNRALSGHRQVTDAYLLALAEAHGGVLATLDRGLLTLAERPETVEIVV